jgi:hypothetical protein
LHLPLQLYVHRAAGPFTPRNGPGVTPRNCGIATCLNRATGTVGLSPTGLWPCRPLHMRQTKTLLMPRYYPCTPDLRRLLRASVGSWPLSGRSAARAALGFGGLSTGFPVGLSPTPIAHVSASPPLIPDSRISRVRLAAMAFPLRTFPFNPKLKCSSTYAP